jgi:hypothetical protein
MSVTYCANCGKKITYEINKPENCSGCGESLGKVFKASAPSKPIIKKVSNSSFRPRQRTGDDEYEDENFEVIIPDSSDVVVAAPKRFTLANLQNGEMPPGIGPLAEIPEGEVKSRAYFHQQD